MIYFRFIYLLFFCFSLSYPFSGQAIELSVEGRLANLKARSRSHENDVAQLLAQPSIPKTDFNLPKSTVSSPPPAPIVSPPSYKPVLEPASEESEFVREVQPQESVVETKAKEEKLQTSTQNTDIEQAYKELYTPKVPNRLEGYYFGPILGLIFPKDGAVRNGMSKEDYASDSGLILGVQIGKDFGGVRAEVEYAYNSFDAVGVKTGSLSASIHNFFTRLILEKELGERFDFRSGLGMGIGIVGVDGSTKYKGTGFAYDFILGAGYRLSDNVGLQIDYRYYLSAANDDYDHIKSHIWLLSAGIDL